MPVTRRVLRAALGAGLLALAAGAQALCTAPLCSCSVATGALVFGAYDPLAGSAQDSSTDLRLTCGGVAGLLINYRVALSAGGSASFARRRLAGGGATLDYNLYQDAGRATVWGDGSAGAPALAGFVLLDALGVAPAQTLTVRGRIAGGQSTARPGSYADTITVTVTYD